MYFDKDNNNFSTRQRVSQYSSNLTVENNEGLGEGVDNQIANLSSQINWLTRQVQDLNGKMMSMFARIEEQDLSLEESNNNVDGLNSKITDLTKQVQDVFGESTDITRQVQDLNGKMISMFERIEKQDKSLEESNNNVDGLNSKITDLTKQVQDVYGGSTDMTRQVQEINGKMSLMYERIEKQDKSLEESNNNVDGLNSKITDLTKQVQDVYGGSTDMTRQVQDLNGKMTSVFERIEKQDKSLEESNSNVAGLNSKINNLTKHVYGKSTDQISDLVQKLQDLNNKMSEQKQFSEALNNDLLTFWERQQKEQQEKLKQQKKDQELQIADLSRQMQGLNHEVSSIYEKMGGQNRLMETFKNELMKLVGKQEERKWSEKNEQKGLRKEKVRERILREDSDESEEESEEDEFDLKKRIKEIIGELHSEKDEEEAIAKVSEILNVPTEFLVIPQTTYGEKGKKEVCLINPQNNQISNRSLLVVFKEYEQKLQGILSTYVIPFTLKDNAKTKAKKQAYYKKSGELFNMKKYQEINSYYQMPTEEKIWRKIEKYE